MLRLYSQAAEANLRYVCYPRKHHDRFTWNLSYFLAIRSTAQFCGDCTQQWHKN